MKKTLIQFLKSNFVKTLLAIAVAIIIYGLLTDLTLQNKDFRFYMESLFNNNVVKLILIIVVPPFCIRNIVRDIRRNKENIIRK